MDDLGHFILSKIGDSSGEALRMTQIRRISKSQITKGGYHGYQFNPIRFYCLHCIDCSTKYLGRVNYGKLEIGAVFYKQQD